MTKTQVAEGASRYPPGVCPIWVDASAGTCWTAAGPAVSLTLLRRPRRKVTHPATTVTMLGHAAQFVMT